jgi:hypothetical protein
MISTRNIGAEMVLAEAVTAHEKEHNEKVTTVFVSEILNGMLRAQGINGAWHEIEIRIEQSVDILQITTVGAK